MFSNLQEWFAYLDSLPSGLTVANLDHVKKVAHILGVTKFPSKIVTVAGTNGKGSCVIFLESILLAAGYKVGAYLSPHLLRYNERIRVNGEAVEDEFLRAAFTVVQVAQDNITLSYFEFSTLVALRIFKQMELDVLLLEVGLGGRLDAVNILDADIAVISTISFDHTMQLGDSREAIGAEKAGIMRKFKPIVCGDPRPPRSIYEQANKTKAMVYCVQRDFVYQIKGDSWRWEFGSWCLGDLPLPQLPIQDAATSLMVIALLLSDIPVDYAAIVQGIKTAFLPGRFQRLRQAPEVIVDVAHNPEAASLLADNLKKTVISGKTFGVCSMFKDKDIAGTIKPLVSTMDKWYIGQLSHVRAASQDQLRNGLHVCGVMNSVFCDDVATAFAQALAEAKENDRIVVFGSFYTVAEILKLANRQEGK